MELKWKIDNLLNKQFWKYSNRMIECNNMFANYLQLTLACTLVLCTLHTESTPLTPSAVHLFGLGYCCWIYIQSVVIFALQLSFLGTRVYSWIQSSLYKSLYNYIWALVVVVTIVGRSTYNHLLGSIHKMFNPLNFCTISNMYIGVGPYQQ